MMKCVLTGFIFLAASSVALIVAIKAQTKSPKAIERYSARADFDWDGDGKPDNFDLRVEKQLDYALTLGEQSKEKFWWYHCWLTVQSGADHTFLWQDEWSTKEDDMSSFSEMRTLKTPSSSSPNGS